MRPEGSAPDLAVLIFPDGLIPQIIELIRDVWKLLLRPAPNELEPTITRRFAAAMQREKRHRGHKFSVRSHGEELTKIDPVTGKGYSVIDFIFQHGDDETCYFGLEAKRLHTTSEAGNWDTGSGDYVGLPGMGAFIEGIYANDQPHAGMLGYVMDGDCAGAKSSIVASMKFKREYLRMSEPIQVRPCRHCDNCDDVFETEHHLDRVQFTIYHVLVAAA